VAFSHDPLPAEMGVLTSAVEPRTSVPFNSTPDLVREPSATFPLPPGLLGHHHLPQTLNFRIREQLPRVWPIPVERNAVLRAMLGYPPSHSKDHSSTALTVMKLSAPLDLVPVPLVWKCCRYGVHCDVSAIVEAGYCTR